MNRRFLSAILLLFVAITFAYLGLHGVPRKNAYVILGIAFAMIAAIRFRRARVS